MMICEYFRSIQGEGIMIGIPTFFVRTAGCNLRCSWCDTAYAQTGGFEASIDEIMEHVGDSVNVCVTGGEPLLQKDMPELLRRLVRNGKEVVLETNGSMDLSDVPDSPHIVISMDMKCPSSGMQDHMCMSNLRILGGKDQVKFIIADNRDLYHAVKILEDNQIRANVIFSPVGGVNIKPLAEDVVARKLNVRVLPQLHKIIWGDQRSV
ncbi:MAG: radical SAM protein [Candidatus Methanomethylophilaceae archaeon]|nr:radical SAM protein [Candidatus Methanomethylophilaceae archaeon]